MVVFDHGICMTFFYLLFFLKYFLLYACITFEIKQINIYFTKKKFKSWQSHEMSLLLCNSNESSECSDKPR